VIGLTGDDVDPVHDTAGDTLSSPSNTHICVEIEVFCNPSTGGTIHADSMNLESKRSVIVLPCEMANAGSDLIQEGDRAVTFCEVTDLLDWSDTTTHGIDAFERDNLGDRLGVLRKFLLEIFQVVVLENDTFRSGMAHALNHGSVIHLIGENYATWEFGPQSGERCIIGHVARGKHQGTVLAMKSSKLILQGEMHGCIPCNITRTTCTMTVDVQSTTTGRALSANSGIKKVEYVITHCMVSSTTGLFPMPR
jgi:hypothetical protein